MTQGHLLAGVERGQRRSHDFADENWLPVVGFPEYEVSDFGRVRRVTAAMGATVGKTLKPYRRRYGHLYVLLRHGLKGFSRSVHSIVAEAFIGPRPTGMEVNHIDFNAGNNHVSNLEYLTHADNNRHSASAGRIRPPVMRGEASGVAKLTEADVRSIRIRRRSGETLVGIAKRFGISHSRVSQIARGVGWTHVE